MTHRFSSDDAAGEKSVFGKLAASGWHTCGMAMRMIVDHWKESGVAEASMGGPWHGISFAGLPGLSR